MKICLRPLITITFIILLLAASGCIMGSKKKSKTKVYVTPCHISTKGLQIRVSNAELNSKGMEDYVPKVLVDDFYSPAGADMAETLTCECYWGKKVGENRDLYYCNGIYLAPIIDESRVIQQMIWKNYTIGFDVEEHDIGTWIDPSGEIHKEEAVYYLHVKDINGVCWKA